jgi:hypothetical protein
MVMISKDNVRDILKFSLVFIRELSHHADELKNLQQIHILSDIAHNLPSMLYDWDLLELNEPEKLTFLVNILLNNIEEYTKKYPQSPYQLMNLLNNK